MDQTEILAQVTALFKRVFENEHINVAMETTADDIDEWDSLNHTAMIGEVEKHFSIRFKLKEMLGFKNVGDMVRTIDAKLQGA
ncbi:MAG: acyl carrier protein [Bacteroidota bacterium]